MRVFKRSNNNSLASNSTSVAFSPSPNVLRAFALEPRILFDGAAAATVDAAVPDSHSGDVLQTATNAIPAHDTQTLLDAVAAYTPPEYATAAPESQPAHDTIIFVDARVRDSQSLLNGVDSHAEVVYLQSGKDGLQQMADYLANRSNIDSVVIVAEGNQANIWLGNTWLTNDRLQQHATQLAQIGQALTAEGDIQIYSCNLGEDGDGDQFVQSFAELTGADVAASNNRTGIGGDWNLEITTGAIEAVNPFSQAAMDNYGYGLATLTVTSGADSGAGSLRADIAAAISGDTIAFDTTSMGGSTVTLSSGVLTINKNLTIDGGSGITITANYTSAVFRITSGTVVLNNLTIDKGLLAGAGGAGRYSPGAGNPGGDALGAGLYIANGATVTADSLTFSNNVATGGGGGGVGNSYAGAGGGGGGGGSGFAGVGGGNGGSGTNGAGGTGSAGAGGAGGAGGANTISGGGTGGAGGTNSGGGLGGTTNGGSAGFGGGASGFGGGGGGAGGNQGGAGGKAVGAIYNAGTLTITNSSFSSNKAGGGGAGGYGGSNPKGGDAAAAIFNAGYIGVRNVTFSTNTSVAGKFGTAADSNGVFGGYYGFVAVANGTHTSTPATYSIGSPLAPLDNGITVGAYNYWDGGNLTVKITANNDSTHDSVGLVSGGTIWVSGTDVRYGASYAAGTSFATITPYDSTNGIIFSFNSSATDTMVQALADAVGFTATSGASTAQRTVQYAFSSTYSASYGSGTLVNELVIVSGGNAAPVVTAGATLAYTENGSAATMDATITVSDADDANISGATVTLSSGFTSGDSLGFNTQNGITGSYNSATGVLTLSGTATKAQYQTALRSVTYSNSSDTPTSSSASRTVTWAATDANASPATSSGVTSTVNVTAVNDTPVLTAGATLPYTEGGSAAAIDTTITLSDADDANIAGATVTLSAGFTSGDTLGFSTQNGITGSYNSGTGVLTLSGTATKAQYQTALRSVTYASSSATPTSSSASRTVTWAVTDANAASVGAQTSSGVTSTINVTASNAKPVLTAGATQAYTEAGSAAAIDATITVSDADDAIITGATVTLSAGFTSGDTLGFSDQNGISGSYNSGTGVLTLSGTATKAQYQTALRSVTYSSTSTTPALSSASRTVTWAATDANAESLGAQTSNGVTSTINVTATNTKPVLTAGAALAYTENGSAAAIDTTMTVSDTDDANMAGATVTISSGFTSGDALGFTNQNGITGSYNSGTGVLTLTGTATKSQYETALRSVTYSSTSDNPTGTSASRTITWAITDANAESLGAQTSTGVTSSVNLTAVNDAPTAIALSASTASTYDSGSNVAIGSLSRTDVDGGGPTYSIVSVNTDTSGATYNLFNISGTTLQAASPSTTTPGNYTVVVRVNDGDNNYDQSFTITVSNTLVVDTTTDDVDDGSTYASEKADGTGLSLREAVGIANRAGGATISFASGLGTVALGPSITIGENIALDADVVNTIIVSGDIAIASGKTLTVANNSGDLLTLSGNISGAGSLTKNGAGTLVLSGSNSYSGDTVLAAGTLSIGGDANLGSDSATVTLSGGNLTITSAGTIDDSLVMSAGATITNANAVTLSGNLTGNNALTKDGASELTLSGTNVLASSTVIGGTLTVADSTNLGTGAVTLNGGSLTVTGSGVTVSNAVALAGAGTITNVNAVVLSGIVSGTGALTKAGVGTLTLSGDNTYSGATAVNDGTLVAAHNNALGTAAGSTTVASGASLGLQGGLTVAEAVSAVGTGISSAGAIYNVSGTNILSGNVTLTGAAFLGVTSDQLTLSGNIGGGFNITKAGAGTLVLSGSNSYNNTSVSAGTLSLATDGNLGSGTVTLAGGTTLIVTGATTIDNAVALSGNATLDNSTAVALSGAISGAGTTLTKGGAGTLTLSSTSNSAAATTALTLTGGTLSVGAATTMVGGTLTLNGGSLTITGSGDTYANAITLANDATITNASAATLSGQISGSAALTKAGAGTLTLSNTGNSSAAATLAVTAGTVSVASDSRLIGGAVTLNGGTLNLANAGTLDNPIALGSGNGTISVTNGAATLSGIISGTGSLTKTGGPALTLSGNNSYSGGTTIRGANGVSITGSSTGAMNLGTGDVTVAGGSALTITGTGTTVSNNITLLDDSDPSTSVTITNANAVTLSGILSGAEALTKAGAGTLSLTGSNTHTGAVAVSVGGLTLVGGSSIGNTSAVTVDSGATLTLGGGAETIGSLAGAGNVVLGYKLTLGGNNTNTSFSGAISGSGNGIEKTGTGTMTLSGANTYTGSTTVSAGTLALSGNSAIADASAVTVLNGGTLNVSGTETVGSIAGAGAIALVGTLRAGSNNTSTEFSGAISGSGGGSLTKQGTGTLNLSGTNTYNGGTTISAGTVIAGSTGALAASGVDLAAGTTLTFAASGSFGNYIALSGSATINVGSGYVATLSNTIDGAFNLTKTGTGALTVSGATTYSGTTTVSEGTLYVTGSLGATSSLSVASGATLGGMGSIFAASSGNNLTINDGATLAPGVAGVNNGIGTLTVNGNLRVSGSTTIDVAGNGGVGGTDFDQVMVNGTVALNGGSLTVSRVNSYTATNGATYRIIDNDSTDAVTGATGIFGGVTEGTDLTSNGDIYTVRYASGTGNDVVLTAVVNPSVTGVSATTTDGSYKAGDTVTITVTFDRSVTVTGVPTLTLNTGQAATYAGGSGGTTLSFSYTVQAGDTSADLDYGATSSLALNGGTILDSSTSLAAVLTLASPGAANSLGANKDIVVDTTAPAAPGLALNSDSGSSNSDRITNIGAITVSGLEGGASWEYSTNGGSSWTTGSGSSFTLSGDGAKSVVVRQTDTTGNLSGSSSAYTFTLDTSATAPTLALAEDNGSSNSDGITNNATVNVTGLETGASWEFSSNGGTSWSAGSGSSFNLSGDGAKSVIVRQNDTAGNASGNSAALAFNLDTSAPTTPVGTLGVAENSANGAVVGSVSATDTLSVVYSLVDNANGRFVIDAASGEVSVADGSQLDYEVAASHAVTVRATDAAGNSSDTVLTVALTDANDAPTGDVTISGAAVVGETLAVSNTLADADGLGSIVYTWTDGNGNILGTGPSLVLASEYVDKTIVVTASYTDGLGKVEIVSSTATLAVASGNAINATQTVDFNSSSSGGFTGGSFTTGSQIPTNLIQPINTGFGLGVGGGTGSAPTGPGGGSGGSGALSTGGSAGGLGGGLGDSLGNGTGGGFGFGPSIFSSSFGDSGTSSTSTQTTSLQMEAQLDTGSNNSFTMPADALLGLDTSTGVSFQAAQADGASLPSWVRFDSATGSLSLKEGGGERTVVKITATDGKGNQTVITVVLKPQQPGQRQNGEGRPGGQEGRGGQGRSNQSRPVGGEPRAQLGKMPLSTQLQAFGTQRTHQDADALLENLARVFAEPRDAA
ncbi:DUF4347 domain-containing protein [Methylomonas methanica]|uniref:Cadherin domain-containing protein n=1 Tax=Methylomonas methanica TaxID=421 RepID=A0A177M575_METMH|nr:DUF4347 domain-containing protein [Methylomonas methanica]OAI00842.1 hypothetical protein A1332_18355 [Methylomonas methanica]